MRLSRRSSVVATLLVALMLALLGAVVAGCGDSAPSGGAAVITVVGKDGSKDYSLEQLKDLPSAEGYAGIKSSTGRITPPVMMKGVLLEDLFKEVGGLADDSAVGITAKDGYEMTMSVSQLKSGDFLTYDMVTGAEITVAEPIKVIIAYEYDGKPIDPNTDGPLRLAIISSEKNQVTDGHWSVKWVSKVQVKAIEQQWSLVLKGYLSEEIDKATFESGSASGCHGNDWTDADGNRWTGVPLYFLVGRVDDDVSHNGPAYNRELAQAGYQVKITSAGGKIVEVDSKTMYYNRAILVAYKLNGEALPEEYWPLRLVGEGLSADSTIGQVSEIEALVPAK
jgi:DMSO/TMAO reductase YedYZ molybdopterin-dependent catalytic subunit